MFGDISNMTLQIHDMSVWQHRIKTATKQKYSALNSEIHGLLNTLIINGGRREQDLSNSDERLVIFIPADSIKPTYMWN